MLTREQLIEMKNQLEEYLCDNVKTLPYEEFRAGVIEIDTINDQLEALGLEDVPF